MFRRQPKALVLCAFATMAGLQAFSSAYAFDPTAVIDYLLGKSGVGVPGNPLGVGSQGTGGGSCVGDPQLPSGAWLYPGQDVLSNNCDFDFVMQDDGNLVLYASGPGAPRRAIWASGTAGHSVQGVVMQGDGNLVIYDTSGVAIWASNTAGHSGAYLVDQDDGNTVIYGPNALWATQTSGFAGEGRPALSTSYYVRTSNTSTLYNLGCNQGNADAASGQNSEVVLDFGGQTSDTTGTYLTGTNAYVTNAQIESLAESFANGYYICTGYDTYTVLKLAIGTNNSAGSVSSAGGGVWASVVAQVVTAVSQNNWSSQVDVGGASDMELDWNTQANTLAWVSGYAGGGDAFLVDYGDAGGCPPYGSCNNGWSQAGVWEKSWGSPPAEALPEIYYTSQAQEWAQISVYSTNQQGIPMLFEGPLDEYDLASTTLTSQGAWNALWTQLNQAGVQPQMTYSAEINVAS